MAATYQDFQLVEVKPQQSFVTHEISRLTTYKKSSNFFFAYRNSWDD